MYCEQMLDLRVWKLPLLFRLRLYLFSDGLVFKGHLRSKIFIDYLITAKLVLESAEVHV